MKIHKNAIIAYNSGNSSTWWGSNSSFILNSDLIPFESIQKLVDNSIKPTDILYFTKISDVPRFKLKTYTEVSGVILNKTNRIEYADVLILSMDKLMELYKPKNNYRIFNKVPKDHPLAFTIISDLKKSKSSPTLIDNNYYIIATYPNQNDIKIFDQIHLREVYIDGNGEAKGSGLFHGCIDVYKKIEDKITSNKPLKIVEDKVFMGDVNASLGNTINDEMLENLKTMFNSNDQASVNLAIDFLANSNLNTSRLKVSFLMWEFRNKIKGCTATANSKALKQYFRDSGWNQDDFFKFLCQQKYNNDNQKTKHTQHIKKHINNQISSVNNNFVKDIVIS